MIVLVLAILIGIGFSFFSVQNAHGVTITLANYPLTGVPLYAIVIVTFLIGIVLSFIVSLFTSLSSFFSLHRKDATIHTAETTIKKLEQKIHELEIENQRLRNNRSIPNIVDDEMFSEKSKQRHPFSFLNRLRGNY